MFPFVFFGDIDEGRTVARRPGIQPWHGIAAHGAHPGTLPQADIAVPPNTLQHDVFSGCFRIVESLWFLGNKAVNDLEDTKKRGRSPDLQTIDPESRHQLLYDPTVI
jgi:hypothetical protein